MLCLEICTEQEDAAGDSQKQIEQIRYHRNNLPRERKVMNPGERTSAKPSFLTLTCK